MYAFSGDLGALGVSLLTAAYKAQNADVDVEVIPEGVVVEEAGEAMALTGEEAARASSMLEEWRKQQPGYVAPTELPPVTQQQIDMMYLGYKTGIEIGRTPGPLLSKPDWLAAHPEVLDPRTYMRQLIGASPALPPLVTERMLVVPNGGAVPLPGAPRSWTWIAGAAVGVGVLGWLWMKRRKR